MLSPKQLAQKLDERFRVLTGGDRTALPRQQTMRALIDWSYDLLSDGERDVFRRLSIFAGSFTLEAAAAVCVHLDDVVVFDLLSSLVDKSLVQAEPLEAMRYRLLESTRQYAREKLIDAGEYDATALAHARAFVDFAERIDVAWETTPDRDWLTQIEPEVENIRAALGWAFGERGDLVLGQSLAAAFSKGWWYLASGEGMRWVKLARDRVDANTPAPVIAALDHSEALLSIVLNQHKAARAAAERAVALSGELGDRLRLADAHCLLGIALTRLGDAGQGEKLLHQALSEARALKARKQEAYVLQRLADAYDETGDILTARQFYDQALAAARPAGAARLASISAVNLAEMDFRGGDAQTALQLVRESMTAFREFHDTRDLANAKFNEAAYLVALQRYDDARVSAREALTAARDMQWPFGIIVTLQHLAGIAALRPNADAPRAARILGYVDAAITGLGTTREYTEQHEHDAAIAAIHAALGADELAKLMTEGTNCSEDQAVAEALLI